MNKDQELVETVDLGIASVETRGNDPIGFEPHGGRKQGMGLSDLD